MYWLTNTAPFAHSPRPHRSPSGAADGAVGRARGGSAPALRARRPPPPARQGRLPAPRHQDLPVHSR